MAKYKGSPLSLTFVSKAIAFDGATGTGAVGSVSIFTVTGEVLIISLVPFCTENLAEAAPTATLALGVTGNTTLFIAATTGTNINASEFWVDATPDANGVALPAALKAVAITDNIIGTVGAQNITDGTIRFDCWYLPLSADGAVI